MITTRKELKEYLKADLEPFMYPNWRKKVGSFLLHDFNSYRYRYLVHLRKLEYHSNHPITHVIPCIYHKIKKNKLGIKLNWEIPCNTFGKGLHPWHPNIVVNGDVKVGESCLLHGNNCFGRKSGYTALKGCPNIGDNFELGFNSSVFGPVSIANNVIVGANSFVSKSIEVGNSIYAGCPAKEILPKSPNYKVSIIIPIYNVEDYLRECLESVINQTYKNIEIICVNDGSTDSSNKILDEYSKKDKRIQIINKPNGGLSSARNAGLDICTGDYIYFVDSDDYIELNTIELLITKIGCNDICYCGVNLVKEDGTLKYSIYPNVVTAFNEDKVWDLYFDRYYLWAMVAWNKLYKKSIFDDLRYDEGKLCEDAWILHKILSKATSITTVATSLHSYRQRDNSIMRVGNPIVQYDCIDAYLNRLDYFKSKKHLYKKYGSELMMDIIHQYCLFIDANNKNNKYSNNDIKLVHKKICKVLHTKSIKRNIYFLLFKICPSIVVKHEIR